MAAQSQSAFVRWVDASARPFNSSEPGANRQDLEAFKQIIGSARVVALGEPTHGVEEPLAFRNRVIRFLVEQMGFTAVALRPGCPNPGE